MKSFLIFALLLTAPALSAEDDAVVIAPRTQKPPLTSDQILRFKSRIAERDIQKIAITADELARSGDPAALPLLCNLYDTGDASRRKIAITAIDQLLVQGRDEVLLRITFGDPFIALRMAAADALARSPHAPQHRERLAKVVLGEPGKPQSPIFQFRAIQSLARMGGKEAGRRIADWLKDPNPSVAAAAADGLGVLNDSEFAPELVAALANDHPEVKPAVVDALERISGESFRYDLVRWHDWLKNRDAKKAAQPPDSGYEDTYDGVKIPASAATDIIVVFDTTGSMTHIWPQLCNAIDAVLREMIKQSQSLRMGLVLYRADSPEVSMNYTIKPILLTRDHQTIRDKMDEATFGGGSGGVNLGLDYALKAMPWRTHARKIVILIGDTSPRAGGVQAGLQSIREAWEMDRILVTTLYVRTVHGEEHLQTYRLLSSAGAGRFFEYNKAENHLVDLSAGEVDVKKRERPEVTAKKWLSPREKK
jgi:von Willebrand factor type A domain/HEAT repeats